MKEELQNAGMTGNESLVYTTMLENGPSHAGLISRKSGLHRRVVYDTIERLIKKGLVGYILENNVKLFSASNPNRVIELLKEKEQYISEIMPSMMDLYSKTREKEETSFYKGKNGLKTVFEDQLSSGKDILILGASPLAYEMMEFYFHWFDKRRALSKIRTRAIIHKPLGKKKIPLCEFRYLPQKYSSLLAVNIYGNKVAIVFWSKEKPFAVVISQKEIAQGYRNYFEFLWKKASKA